MMNWNYNAADYKPNETGLLRMGNHNVRIITAKQIFAKNGTEGLEISLEVYGYSNKLRHYIWFNYDYPGYTNMKLGEFFDSFGISENERNSFECWVGKVGAVNVAHHEYKGRMIAKVDFCIRKEFQKNVPEWPNATPVYPNTVPAYQSSTPTYQNLVPTYQNRNSSAEPGNMSPQPQAQPMSFDGFVF